MHNLTAHHRQRLTLGTAFVGAALLLASCGDGGTTPQDPCTLPTRSGEQAGIICGSISGTTASQVKAMPQVVEGDEFKASVREQSLFEMPLPAASIVESKYGSDLIPFKDTLGVCDPLNVTGDTGLKMININSLQTDQSKEIESVVSNATNSKTYTYWWFANKDAQVNVNGSCLFLGNINNQTFSFKRGWNLVKLTTDGASSTYQVMAPTATQFTFTPVPLSSQSLKPNFHRLWLNLDQYKNRQ